MRKMLSLRKLLVSVIVAAMTMAIIPFAVVDASTTVTVNLIISTWDYYGQGMAHSIHGGTAVVNKNVVSKGETITVTAVPNSDYSLDSISFSESEQILQDGLNNQYTVPMDYDGESVTVDVVFRLKNPTTTYPVYYKGYSGLLYTSYAPKGAKIFLDDFGPYWYCPAGKHFEGWLLTDWNGTNNYISKNMMESGYQYTVTGSAELRAVFKNWFTGWTDTGDGGVVENTVGDALQGGLGSTNPYLPQTPGETVYFEFELKDGYILDNDNKVEIIGADGQTVLKTLSMSKYPNSNYYRVSFTMPDQDISFKFKTKSLYKTVTFNSNGGSSVPAQTVDNGYKATKPADPTKSGYTFGGWYTDSACTTAFDFNTAVTSDITLYAKWTAVVTAPKLTTGIAHVQDIGDVSVAVGSDGVLTIGTTGMGKRLEQITINFENNTPYSGTLQYRVHVQNIGWMEWTDAGQKCGTEGQSLRIEAIEIRFTGELADYYSVEYCVHIQDYGDMQGWVKDGALAGTTGESKRIEELKIRIVPKNSGSSMSVKYRVHVQDYGWEKSYATNGAMSGTSGESKRLEGIELFLSGTQYSGGIKYKTHVQDYGWQGWSYDGEMSGTQGEAKRLEGICIELYGEIADYYDIYYRVHAQDIGWMAWAKNGECAGTAGRSARLEGIQIVLVPKGEPAPGATYEGITAVTDKAFVEGF
jgi:uncharacterized repeat protein (TIGR02543 family)